MNALTTFTYSKCAVMLIITSFRINIRKFILPIREKPTKRFKRVLYTCNSLARYQLMSQRHRYIHLTVILVASLFPLSYLCFHYFLEKKRILSKRHIISLLSYALVHCFTLVMNCNCRGVT